MTNQLLGWAVAGALGLMLALAHAFGPGAAALALGRRRLGAVLAGLHLAAALVAYPVLAAYAPPLSWDAWRWYLALFVAYAALVALPAAAYLFGWDRARASRLRARGYLGLVGLCVVLHWTALVAVRVLPGALGALEWDRVRPADNAAAPSFPEGERALLCGTGGCAIQSAMAIWCTWKRLTCRRRWRPSPASPA